MIRNKSIISFDSELLSKLLPLPDGTKILHCREVPSFSNGSIAVEFQIEHKSLPESTEGSRLPRVTAILHQMNPGDKVSFTKWSETYD